VNLDFSLFRTFFLTEGVGLEFRAEAFQPQQYAQIQQPERKQCGEQFHAHHEHQRQRSGTHPALRLQVELLARAVNRQPKGAGLRPRAFSCFRGLVDGKWLVVSGC
jgi:hypothetical protein